MSKRLRTSTGAGVAVVPDATLRYFTPTAPDAGLALGEEVRLSVPGVALQAGGEALGVGTLRVTTQRVHWLPAAAEGAGGAAASASAGAAAGRGYALEYPRIVLHAMCRDAEAFPSPCLYCQVSGFPSAEGGEGGGEEGMGDGAGAWDVYFAPRDAGSLDALFAAMTACAEMHPDPADEQLEEEGGEAGGSFAWAEALMAQAEAGGGAVAGQFDDAEGAGKM